MVNNLTGFAFTTGKVFLKSDGTSWRPLVHIEDISRAFLALMEAPRDVVHDQAFNVGSTEENYRIRDVAELVGEIVPGSQVTFSDEAFNDLRNYRVNCDKLAEAIGFQTKWTVPDGIRELYEAYRANGLTLEDLEGNRYMRIKRVARAARRPAASAPTWRWTGVLIVDCRICGADGVLPFLDLGKTPLSDGLVRPERLDGPEPRYALEVAFCPIVQDRPHPRGRGPGDPLPRGLPLLLLLLRPPAGALPRPRAGPHRVPPASDRTASWSSWPPTTATCCATSSRPACRCWASTRPPTRCASPTRPASARCCEFFGVELAERSSPASTERPRRRPT